MNSNDAMSTNVPQTTHTTKTILSKKRKNKQSNTDPSYVGIETGDGALLMLTLPNVLSPNNKQGKVAVVATMLKESDKNNTMSSSSGSVMMSSMSSSGTKTNNMIPLMNTTKTVIHTSSSSSITIQNKRTKMNNWCSNIYDDEWAEPSIDGKTIICQACTGKLGSRTNGVITMQHPYSLSVWESYCKTKGHRSNVHMKKSISLLNNNLGCTVYKDTIMINYFSVVKQKEKKNSNEYPPPVSEREDALVEIKNDNINK